MPLNVNPKNVYFVVLVDGVPEAVSADLGRASQVMRELSSRNRVTTVVPCAAIAGEAQDFDEEAPTDPCFGCTPDCAICE